MILKNGKRSSINILSMSSIIIYEMQTRESNLYFNENFKALQELHSLVNKKYDHFLGTFQQHSNFQ